MLQIIHFLSLLCSGLLAGMLLGLFIGYNPTMLQASATIYIEVHQSFERIYTRVMPYLMSVSILLAIVLLFLDKPSFRVTFPLTLASLLLLVGTLLLTLFGEFPLNRELQGWKPEAPPQSWSQVRLRWTVFHALRTLCAFLSFIFLLCGVLWA